MPNHRDYTVLGTTQSLCPDAVAGLEALLVRRGELQAR